MIESAPFLSKTCLVILVAMFVMVNARPSHLGDSSQLLPEQENNQQLELGLKPWQIEMLAQKLEEMNQIGNDDYAYERSLRSGTEKKRRYRTCFFNPVSCFKKK